MSTALPEAYCRWAESCNRLANSQQFFLGAKPPLLPCPTDPEQFWVLYQGSYSLRHWSEIPALFAPLAEPA